MELNEALEEAKRLVVRSTTTTYAAEALRVLIGEMERLRGQVRGPFLPEDVTDLPFCVIGTSSGTMNRQNRNWYSTQLAAEDHAAELLLENRMQPELLVVKIVTKVRRSPPIPPPIERIRVP